MGTEQQAKFVGHGIGIQINELPVLTPRSKEAAFTEYGVRLGAQIRDPGCRCRGYREQFPCNGDGRGEVDTVRREMIPLGN